MTNEEMKRALEKGGMTTADIEKVSDRFDAEKLTEMVEAAHTPEEAFAAIHAAYPELAVSELEKQCDFIREQFEATLKEQKKSETVELSEDELENVAGGGFFGDVGSWFKKNWKAVAVGAAIVVACVATVATAGAGAGLVGGVIAWGASTFGVGGSLSTLAAMGTAAIGLTGVTTATAIGAGVGAAVGAGAGAAILGATDVLSKANNL